METEARKERREVRRHQMLDWPKTREKKIVWGESLAPSPALSFLTAHQQEIMRTSRDCLNNRRRIAPGFRSVDNDLG